MGTLKIVLIVLGVEVVIVGAVAVGAFIKMLRDPNW